MDLSHSVIIWGGGGGGGGGVICYYRYPFCYLVESFFPQCKCDIFEGSFVTEVGSL